MRSNHFPTKADGYLSRSKQDPSFYRLKMRLQGDLRPKMGRFVLSLHLKGKSQENQSQTIGKWERRHARETPQSSSPTLKKFVSDFSFCQPSFKPAGQYLIQQYPNKQMHFRKELISTETPARSLMSSAKQNKSRKKNRIFPQSFIQEENRKPFIGSQRNNGCFQNKV